MKFRRTDVIVVGCFAIVAGIIGCGGSGANTFTTTTSTAGDFGTRRTAAGGDAAGERPQGPAGTAGQSVVAESILFASIEPNAYTLQAFRPDTAAASVLTKLENGQTLFAQSPSTENVAFGVESDGFVSIHVNKSLKLDGAQRIGETRFTEVGSVQFTPDGRRLVFTAQPKGEEMGVYVASLDGKTVRRLDDGEDVSVSSDGKRIVYSKPVNGNGDLFVRDLADGKPKAIVSSPAEDILPQWSKDGKRVLFTSNREGGRFGVFVVASGGGAAKKMVPGDAIRYGATFSPDSRSIAYNQLGETPETTGIYTIPAAGGAPRRVVDRVSDAGFVFWATPSVGPGRSAKQPGAPALRVSPRVRGLLKLPDQAVTATMITKPEEKPAEKPADKSADEPKKDAKPN